MDGNQLIDRLAEAGTGAGKLAGVRAKLAGNKKPTAQAVVGALAELGHAATAGKAVTLCQQAGVAVVLPLPPGSEAADAVGTLTLENKRLGGENADLRRQLAACEKARAGLAADLAERDKQIAELTAPPKGK